MKYGLIGEHLAHSFSADVHSLLADYTYEIREIPRNELDTFMKSSNFTAINVTIPYKEAVLPYINHISDEAKAIGSVNTVVNKDGILYGYNTDFFGMTAQIEKMHLNLKGKKTVILGTGGTSKTALAVAKALGADPVITVSRTKKEGSIDYEELLRAHTDAEIIINTTPVGMYPDNRSVPVEISRFTKAEGVIDAIYNPIRTQLVIEAEERGIKAEGGLYMLVAQAAYASEIFLGKKYTKEKINKIFGKIKRKKENIVLIGMPASGKTTIAKLISKEISREVIDTDKAISRRYEKSIREIFDTEGEAAFREYESEEIANISLQNNKVISTGGGSILKKENVDMLKQNGVLFFIDRPCDRLSPSMERPLSTDKDAIKKLYDERYGKYLAAADVRIDANDTPLGVARSIIGVFYK